MSLSNTWGLATSTDTLRIEFSGDWRYRAEIEKKKVQLNLLLQAVSNSSP